MRFDISDSGWVDPCVGQGRAQQRLLRGAVGRGEPVAAAVLIRGGAADHRDDGIAVGARVGQALEYQDAATLAAHETVRAGIERLAAAIGRQHAGFRQSDVRVGGQDEIDAASQSQITIAIAQALDREMARDQRG